MSKELEAKEAAYRQQAATHYDNNQSHLALNALSEATRIRVWIEMQGGYRPHMVECVRLNPKPSLTRKDKQVVDEWIEDRYPATGEYARVRSYQLEYVPPPDSRIAQAYEQIIYHKPQGKQMPARINLGSA